MIILGRNEILPRLFICFLRFLQQFPRLRMYLSLIDILTPIDNLFLCIQVVMKAVHAISRCSSRSQTSHSPLNAKPVRHFMRDAPSKQDF